MLVVDNRTQAQKDGLAYEERLADLLSAKLQPGSGNQWYALLDLDTVEILFSLKHTGKTSLSVTRYILREAIQAATGLGKRGAIPCVATDIDGEDFIILRANDFAKLMEEEVKFVKPSRAEEKRQRAAIPEVLRKAQEGDDNDR